MFTLPPGLDAPLHFLVSYALALYNPLLSFAVGIGREFCAIVGPGVADLRDVIANLLGIFVTLF